MSAVKRAPSFLSLGCLLLVGAAACSGSSSGSLVKARTAYIVKAEAVCQKANDQQKALKTPTSVKQLSPYVDAVVRIADETSAALGKLTPPKKDKADLDKHVFSPLREQLAKGQAYADRVRTAAKRNDVIELAKLLSDPPNKTAADLSWMRHYGFQQCVDAADTSG